MYEDIMGYFDLPKGELELLMDGNWKSVMFTDRPSMDEIMDCVATWSRNHEVTAARYSSHRLRNEAPVTVWKCDGVMTFNTYPPMFIDYDELIENVNYDNEKRVFTVSSEWALKWIDENSHYKFGFWKEYTYDDTLQMFEDACRDGELISDRIEPEWYEGRKRG